MNINKYFNLIRSEVDKQYEIASRARAVGIDPIAKVEVPIATTLAEKAVGLISVVYPQLDNKIVDRINWLEKEYGALDAAVAFKIAEEIAKEKFCKFENLLQAIEAGIRVGFAYITLGVVSSPIEGFTELKFGKTRKGEDYFIAFFSGPIRSAGTTASCVVLMLIDYLREAFGFAKYDPDENEIKRYVTENYDYHERVTNLQYLPTEEEIIFLAQNLPIQISGEPTSKREVSNYKDLPRVGTSLIRGGMCLIFSEGLAQKAQKGLRVLRGLQEKGVKLSDWEFLEKYISSFKQIKKEGKIDTKPVYIKDLVAGRPVFSHPSRSGGFRFRYGRSRTSGFSAVSVHPATMAISGGFMSAGTQLKVEKPTKGCVISACDEIDGPIVKLKDGTVRKIENFDEAKKIYNDVEEIIYLGDILFSFGDVINRNYELLKPGYVEEWWELELKKVGGKEQIDKFHVGFDEAIDLSKRYGIPLHPKFIFYWNEIENDDFLALIDWIAHGKIAEGKLILPYTRVDRERFARGKRAFEIIGCEHSVSIENVVLDRDDSKALLFNLGVDIRENDFDFKIEESIKKVKEIEDSAFKSSLSKSLGIGRRSVLEIINELCEVKIKDKSGTFIGARMGRPEKAKLRKLKGSPHVLFPVGEEGGRLRSFQAALEAGSVSSEFPNFYCDNCKSESVYSKCPTCQGICRKFETRGREFSERRIDIRNYFDEAKKIANVRIEDIPIVKGVRGTSNKDHSCEHLAKGLLRAKYNLNVNKDGTIRYDMTEMVLTHFRPREIGVSVKKLQELGYEKDIYGKDLESDDQILELFPHDIVLPACPESADERADDVFFRLFNFVDDELERLYGIGRFFNVKSKEDLLGALVACIAPHICTATVARVIGFSKTQGFLASPYMHAAMRRDADGDECAVILLIDLLLNFSRNFLPAHRGGTQDAPLVLNTSIKAGDVDDQILDFELGEYGLELYEMAQQKRHSSEVKEIETVKKRLKKGGDVFTNIKFTHNCFDFNLGIVNSSYKSLPTMDEKVDKQMELCNKIRAVDTSDVARLIIERHFIRDTKGNLRKFSMQIFRCIQCNNKFRRPPLGGRCTKCGGKLMFTISEGSILKYMQKALDLARKYEVSSYLIENLELTEMYIQSIFGKDSEKQEIISKWF